MSVISELRMRPLRTRDQIAHARHQFIKRELIAVVDRRRGQAAATNGSSHSGVDVRRWLELPVLKKSVERRKPVRRQGDGHSRQRRP